MSLSGNGFPNIAVWLPLCLRDPDGMAPPRILPTRALTLGNFLQDYIRIDPEVVHGVEFACAADVDSVLSFARFAETKADLSGASLDGLHSQLQGYVAEQIAAQHLIAQGHDVLFPHTGKQSRMGSYGGRPSVPGEVPSQSEPGY